MGWASATPIVEGIIAIISKEVANVKSRKRIYKVIISEFENNDWDTQDECLGIDKMFDEAMKELHPKWFKENKWICGNDGVKMFGLSSSQSQLYGRRSDCFSR